MLECLSRGILFDGVVIIYILAAAGAFPEEGLCLAAVKEARRSFSGGRWLGFAQKRGAIRENN